jgi:hypothetical protein
MYWYEVGSCLEQKCDNTLDLFSQKTNTIDLFQVYRDKIEEVEGNVMTIQTELFSTMSESILRTELDNLKSENIIIKKMLKRMATKEYPELIFEHPEYFAKSQKKS